jgi:hypothetical protein
MLMDAAELSADGSAEADVAETVVIDRNDPSDWWRHRCPTVTRWAVINNHLFYSTCLKIQVNVGANPEYCEILGKKAGERAL